jgi:hypothetical protein
MRSMRSTVRTTGENGDWKGRLEKRRAVCPHVPSTWDSRREPRRIGCAGVAQAEGRMTSRPVEAFWEQRM